MASMTESDFLKVAVILDGQGVAIPFGPQAPLTQAVPYWVYPATGP